MAEYRQPGGRIVGIDDWAWQKGCRCGTIMVDLERREVVDVLSDRSADIVARWLCQHPSVEIVSRDRCGLYAEGARRGALGPSRTWGCLRCAAEWTSSPALCNNMVPLECPVGGGGPNLKHQMSAAWRPAHLLLRVHLTMQ